MILYVLSTIMIIVAIIGGLVSLFKLFLDDFESSFMKVVTIISTITSIVLLIISIVGLVYSSGLNSVVEYHYTQKVADIIESKNEMEKFLIGHPEYKEIYEKENLE